MNRYTLELIQETAVEAGPVIVVAPEEPKGVYYIRDGDKLERVESLRGVAHTAEDIESLSALTVAAQKFARDSDDPDYTERAIYYTPGDPRNCTAGAKVVGVLSARGRVTLTARHSQPFVTLQQIASKNQSGSAEFSQQELYWLLRTTFADSLPSSVDLLAAIRKVDIKKVQEASGTVERKGVSMSRSMVADASGVDVLPDRFAFSVPVYEGSLNLGARVECRLELDAQAERFRLTVLPGQIDVALEQAAFSLRELVVKALGEKSSVPVYRGSPTAA